MNIRTIESNFEYQAKQVFNDMLEEYKEEQKYREKREYEIHTFAEWLWDNKAYFGEQMFTRLDEYVGIEEFTEDYNFKTLNK